MKILVPDCSANRCGKIYTWTKISLPPEGNMNKCYDEPAAPTSGKMNLVYEMVSQVNDVKKNIVVQQLLRQFKIHVSYKKKAFSNKNVIIWLQWLTSSYIPLSPVLYLIDMTTFHVFFSYISGNFWFCISKLHTDNSIMFPTNNR